MTDPIVLFLVTGVVVAAGYAAFRFLKNFMARPIPEIHLSAIEKPRWTDERRLMELIDSFRQNGFEPTGDYECPEIPGLTISGFVRPSERMIGVIYDFPPHGIWIDIGVKYGDGRGLTVSNAPMGQEMDHMPGQTKIYCQENSVEELLKKVPIERKEVGRVAITKEQFVSEFEAQYQKETRWRMDRGGPTLTEVRRVAERAGVSGDRLRVENAARLLQRNWKREKEKPASSSAHDTAAVGLPAKFQAPKEFRLKMEQGSGPVPRLRVPALPVYVVLTSFIVWWCWYGWQYHKAQVHSSLTALMVFFVVLAVPLLSVLMFKDLHQCVRLYPILKRVAGLRPGAFLVVDGCVPTLFYARAGWIGMVGFEEGAEGEDACTRLEARMEEARDWLEIRRKGVSEKMRRKAGQDAISLPESEFSRRFAVEGADEGFVREFLDAKVMGAILRLAELGGAQVGVEGSTVRVEVGRTLSGGSREAALRRFLQDAEIVVEGVSSGRKTKQTSNIEP